ncbi:MAG: hypothetical protein KC731_36775 [Myxococcales bacterium]|nr:hypothetical protein [Myxococcales bacterium]
MRGSSGLLLTAALAGWSLAAGCLPDLTLGDPSGGGSSATAGGTPTGDGGSTSSVGGSTSSTGGAGSGGDGGGSGVGGMMGSGGGPVDCGSSCTCDNGDTCEFTCSSSPCDANCVGASNCTAECANATCNCQGGSICSFFCTTPNCRVSCTQGSQCLLDCNTFAPQSVACDFQNCQSGTIACPDGKTLACNATCP